MERQKDEKMPETNYQENMVGSIGDSSSFVLANELNIGGGTTDSLGQVRNLPHVSNALHSTPIPQSNCTPVPTKYNASSSTMPDLQQASIHSKSESKNISANLMALPKLGENQSHDQPMTENFQMPDIQRERISTSSSATYPLLNSQQIQTSSIPGLGMQIGRTLSEKYQLLDNICRAMLMSIRKENKVSREKQEQLKEYVDKVYMSWLVGEMSRKQMQDSIKAFLCMMFPEAGDVNLDVLFKIWDDQDLRKSREQTHINIDNAHSDQPLSSSMVRPPQVSTLPTPPAPIPTSTLKPAQHKDKSSNNPRRSITQEQIIVGHFCRHSIKLLSRIMQGHPEAPRKEGQLKDHIKKLWARWVKSQISRPLLLDSVATFVREACPEAEGVDVVHEFKVWYELEFEKQRQRNTAPNPGNIDQ